MAKGKVVFEEERCKGCGICVPVCPTTLIEMNGEKINVKGYSPAYAARPEDCIACGNCAITCPDSIISVYRID